jgi:anti-sigma factor (TIGR02949 family)
MSSTPVQAARASIPCDAARDRVLELLDGAFDAASARSCAAHLSECAACRADLAQHRRLRAALARQAVPAPPTLRARLAVSLAAAAHPPASALARAGG